jgi:RNA 3'-terminal phosphate cyclase (ATP)
MGMITIDGSQGEGGGQILRTSLALALVTGRAFRIEKIRAGRQKPGLMRQHLTAVGAAAEIGQAEVQGAAIGSPELTFTPGTVKPGSYHFAVGTAGSATLVLQTVLPALMLAGEPSELLLEGGTHNPLAPPFEFLARAFLPLLERMGPRVTATLERPGFFPAGGGRIAVTIEPVKAIKPLELLERGEIRERRARAAVAQISGRVAERELKVVADMLGWGSECLCVEQVQGSQGPGNVLTLELASEHVTEVFTGFGQRGVLAEKVAEDVVREVREYLAAPGVPVGRHLADQLLIPLSLAGGGSFRTLPPTRHTMTNAEIVKKFLNVDIRVQEIGHSAWEISVG